MCLRRIYQLKLLEWEGRRLEWGKNGQSQQIFEDPELVCAFSDMAMLKSWLPGNSCEVGMSFGHGPWWKVSDLLGDVCTKGNCGTWASVPFFASGLNVSLACSHVGSCIAILILGWYSQGAATPVGHVRPPTLLFSYELSCLEILDCNNMKLTSEMNFMRV